MESQLTDRTTSQRPYPVTLIAMFQFFCALVLLCIGLNG